MPLEAHNGQWNPFGTPPRGGTKAMDVTGEKDAARVLFSGGGVAESSPGGHRRQHAGAKENNNNVHTPERIRREQHSYDPFVRSTRSPVVKVPSPTGGKMIQIRAR